MLLWYKDLISVSLSDDSWLLWRRSPKEMVENWINEKGKKNKAWNRKTWRLRGKDDLFAGWMVVSITYYQKYQSFLPENEAWVLHVEVESTWEVRHNVAVSAGSVIKLCEKAETFDFPIFILNLPIIPLNFLLKCFASCSSVLWRKYSICCFFVKMSFWKQVGWTVRLCWTWHVVSSTLSY